jgi:hypothetical protein
MGLDEWSNLQPKQCISTPWNQRWIWYVPEKSNPFSTTKPLIITLGDLSASLVVKNNWTCIDDSCNATQGDVYCNIYRQIVDNRAQLLGCAIAQCNGTCPSPSFPDRQLNFHFVTSPVVHEDNFFMISLTD